FHRSSRLRVGWFHQHQIEAMDPEDTPLEIIRRALPGSSESQRRSKLAQFGLSFDKQGTTVSNLSGGERARLLLNLVAMEAPHLLILDEPTNHLDIDSRRALLEALNDYEGAVILITHDRSLMELVADRLWLASDGSIKPFDGDMDDYAKFVLARARQASRVDKAAPTAVSKDARKAAAAAARAQLAPLKKDLDAMEAKVARLTKQLAEIDAALADPKLFKRPNELAQLGRDRSRNRENLDKAEGEWLELAERYEAAKNLI
ncbi:MAG TPA: ATP-binding cassette domain-containing protein, partial [Caulobacteraceae bacterium]|nr:ATP-binding cassette domain-containing protein [Caulobacteraceae bacterium]